MNESDRKNERQTERERDRERERKLTRRRRGATRDNHEAVYVPVLGFRVSGLGVRVSCFVFCVEGFVCRGFG